ncbi:class I SAM-dependent methyltransferase [Oceanicaulis sp.]|uniref:class I SAM-dependent methyltransferase n=1 Tax=Oceanicaulis sp. TaxID=1924941 RepID=UPI003BA87798
MTFSCRHCASPVSLTLVDLGHAPPSNAYINAEAANSAELTFPLRVGVCENCWLVQTEDFTERERLFAADYAYFSSTSTSWLAHARRYCETAIERFGLSAESYVIEIGSNDGYLLQYMKQAGVPCLGVEPTASTAAAARAADIEVVEAFFGVQLARKLVEHRRADLVLANNVYAHVPDIIDFTQGLAHLLTPEGVISLEFPHLLNLIRDCQFDTIYHEHYSYLSLLAVDRIFKACGLRLFDVERLPTHGGSLRVWGCLEGATHIQTEAVRAGLAEERAAGLDRAEGYAQFQSQTDSRKNAFLRFLLKAHNEGRRVAGYGAAAKGNTLLNYAGVKPDLMPFVCDAAPSKQGKLLPGSHIPIRPPEALDQNPPDYLVIFPWNIADEIERQLTHLKRYGTQFITSDIAEN